MCGIFGYSRRTPFIERLLPFLAWEIESRGKDSWGVTNGVDPPIKVLGRITESWEDPGWNRAIFHTRTASCGEKTLENQHPFEFDKADGSGKIIGVHNGIVANHDALNEQYERKFDVDSMHVFAHLAEGKDTREIAGWGAIAYYDGPQMCFAKFNMQDFHVWRTEEGGLVFCSTALPVLRAANMYKVTVTEYQFDGDQKYYVRWDEESQSDVLVKSNPMVFGGMSGHMAPWGSGSGAYDWMDGWSRFHNRQWGSYAGSSGRSGGNVTSYNYVGTGTRGATSVDEIGKWYRAANQCMRCAKPTDRKLTVVCAECRTQFNQWATQGGRLFDVWDRPKPG